jgi:hypothetical protein
MQKVFTQDSIILSIKLTPTLSQLIYVIVRTSVLPVKLLYYIQVQGIQNSTFFNDTYDIQHDTFILHT